MITQKASEAPARLRVPGKRGQTLVEYALILAMISVVAIASMMTMGSQVQSVFTTVNKQLNAANNGGASGRH